MSSNVIVLVNVQYRALLSMKIKFKLIKNERLVVIHKISVDERRNLTLTGRFSCVFNFRSIKKKKCSILLSEQEVRTAYTLQVIVYVCWNALLFQVLVADRHMDRFFS